MTDFNLVSIPVSTMRTRLWGAAFLLATFAVAAPVAAQSVPPPATAANRVSGQSVTDFWTPKRLLDAQPIELHPGPGHKLVPLPGPTAPTGVRAPASEGSGAPPKLSNGKGVERRIHAALEEAPSAAVGPENTSSTGAYFTTSRVFPNAATTAYPYVTAGRLTAHNSKSGATLKCSASALRPRLVVTAGHCVYHAGPTQDDPSTNKYFYDSFLFVPAYNNGAAPRGSWTWAWVIVSGYWTAGGGTVPNAQDIAILEMRDQGGHRMSDYTGYLGYQTGGLAPNHLTIVGYPCNIDNCVRMQNTQAQSYAIGGNNTVVYGTAQRGGTSGGPWIQDFGVAGVGSPAGTALNYLKSVSSYGPIATEPKYIGGSILMSSGASSFMDLLTLACAHKAGNC